MTNVPAAELIAERFYGGIRTARVLCPGCQRTHLHRWPADDSTHTAPCGATYTIGSTE